MKKPFFTHQNFRERRPSLLKAIMVMLPMMLFSLWSNGAFSQCVLACNDHVQVSVDESCNVEITPDMIIEGFEALTCELTVELQDADGNVMPSSPFVNASHINQTVMVSVIDEASGNSCWGTILVEDKLDPTITCPDSPQIDFICSDVDSLYTPESTILDGDLETGNPDTDDNCEVVSVSYSDQLNEGEPCESDEIIRTFVATDLAGNTAACEQSIIIRKPTLADVDLPEQVIVECGELGDVDPGTLADAGYAGFPTITTHFGTHNIESTYCNLGASYVDAPAIDLCGTGYKIVRNWTLFDWCTAQNQTYVQIIKVLDTVAPTVECPTYPVFAAGQLSCDATLTLLDGSGSDNCSSALSYTIELLDQDSTSLGIFAPGNEITIPTGTHILVYTAIDDCGNISNSCYTDVIVQDQTPPVAICDEHTVVSLGSDGTSTVCYQTFDDGSYDNCELLAIKVKRMDDSNNTPFTDCVEFDCGDIGETILVRMRVYDEIGSSFSDGGDNNGRYNECMIEVEVQDKLNPTITCPPDKTIACHGDYSEVEEPAYYDNCDAEVTHTDIVNIDNCGEGTVRRIYTVTDGGGRTAVCTQTITLENDDPFDGNDIDWPNDATVNCTSGLGTNPEDLPNGRNYPDITEDVCDLVAVTHEDQLLPIAEDACYKILRTWTVIDWCQFEVNNDGSYEGYWTYTQIIKVNDTADPIIDSSCEDIEVCNYSEDCDAAYAELILEASDACSSDLNYSYTIDAFDDGIADNGSAFNGESNDASGNYPNGTHHIYWEVEDNCGNISICDYTFTISDCKKPTPICLNGLATVIMPSSGAIELWASDFDAPGTSGSFDNCTAQDNLVLKIRKVSDTNSPLTTLTQVEALGSNVIFTCEDLNFTEVELYVIDEAGNWDYCTTYASIQDNEGVCVDPQTELASIEGHVETEFNEMVEEVTIEIAGGSSAVPAFLTNASGEYGFNLNMNENYTITAEKDINYLNGVSTYDLVLISKHILGLTQLDSPFKIIAADANRSNTVTTLDIVKLRRLVLNIDSELTENNSWRFVEKGFAFPNAANPFQTIFPEVISINDFDSADATADFIAVKVGDVNGSAVPNTLLGTASRNFAGNLIFGINDAKVSKGETVKVDFTAKDFNNIIGYQFAVSFDNTALDFVNAGGKHTTADNFGLALLNEGVITTSWNDVDFKSIKDNQTVFTLEFVATADVKLSEAITLSNNYTAAEAYNQDATLNINLAFNTAEGTTVANGFALEQNQPNPFRNTTVIGFNMPEAATATLTVYTVSGKVLKVVSGKFDAGQNQITLNKNELSGSGMLYYQLDTPTDSATKKMIIMD